MRTLIGAIASMILAMTAIDAAAQSVPAGDGVYTSDLMTRWGREVTPDNAWRSYPRPQLKRERWLNLNGLWDYAIAKASAPQPVRMDGQILVPYPVRSKLSRVARKVTPDDRIWYRRSFTMPRDWAGDHVMLNFGAVDFAATIWVNGAVVGSHKGGFDTFGFDITDYLKPGQNELVVQVADPTSAGTQPRGKQILDPSGIWYTAVSGIWQTVWLEPVPKLHIEDVRATPDIDRGVVDIALALSGWANDTDAVKLTASAGGKVIASTIIRANRRATLAIPNARLWSPDDPYLYDLKAELVTVADPYAGQEERDRKAYDARFTAGEDRTYAAARIAGAPRDAVDTYFAMRKISIGPGAGRRPAGDPAQQQAALSERHARPGLVARRPLHPTVRRGDEERPGLPQTRRLQHVAQAHQGRTGALLLRRRSPRHVDLAGHAVGRRRGPVRHRHQQKPGSAVV